MRRCKLVIDDTIVAGELDLEQKYLLENGYEDIQLVHACGSKEKILEACRDADGVSIWQSLGSSEFDKLEQCKIIVMPGIGVDKYDIPEATKRGICIANVPDFCVEEVAVHSLALMLDCIRNVSFLNTVVKEKRPFEGSMIGDIMRLSGKTFGIISFGNIARKLSQLLKPFGVQIIAYDPFVNEEIFNEYGVEHVKNLNDVFARSSFVSVHTPYSPATHHMIGKEQFELFQDGAVMVVAGRGGVVEETALMQAIRNGKIKSVGLDVMENESTYDSPLLKEDKVIVTPHVASESIEATKDLRRKIIKQLVETAYEKKMPSYLVNKNVVKSARFSIENKE